jgi:hypothetical protein
MMTEREECEECGQVHDPLKSAAMPLAQFVLAETTEGSTRKAAMDTSCWGSSRKFARFFFADDSIENFHKRRRYMNSIEQCQSTIQNLDAKLARVKQRSAEISTERDGVAFAAHAAGDAKARGRLDKLTDEALRQNHEMASLEAALKTARLHLAEAEHAEATAADRQRAKQAKEIADKIGARMKRAHAALSAGFEELAAAERELSALHQTGFTHPNHAAFRVNCVLAVKTLLRKLPIGWRRDFADRIELGHGERLALTTFWEHVAVSIDRQLALHLTDAPVTRAKVPVA